ncbi:MAG: hypothetical protein Q8K86_04050 [Candidatus Nanopelagicaceae bacterium]|nr:hypothetical protein [Candidatus Nanopelagicaceae bacterium]
MLSRYRRSHPHFIRNLSLDVVLSLAIGFAGFQFVAYRSSTPTTLENSRIVAMASDEFIAFVKKHEDPVYWLGPISGNRYSFNQNAQDVDVVSYLPKGSSLSNVNQRKMTVKTYENLATYRSHIRPLMGAYTKEFVTAKGNTVVINELMDVETVTLSGRPEIVVIRYPTKQTEGALIENANNLKLIR